MVLGVNREEDAETALKFIEQHRLTFPSFLDPKREFYSKFTPKYIPWNAVLGRNMTLKYSQAGFDPDALSAAVEKALAEGGGK